MDYTKPSLRRALAAEYVVGSMTPLVRRRFERLLDSDPVLQAEVSAWEDTLYESLDLLPSDRAPPPQVLERIRAALDSGEAPARAIRAARARQSDHPPWWSMLGIWQGAAALGLAASVLLALMLVTRPVPPPTFVAVLGTPENRVGWLVRAEARARGTPRIFVRSISEHTLEPDKMFEVWLLPGPGQGDAPRSLGAAPATGEISRELSEELLRALEGAAGLAVSLEPRGGSPTGAPTGPVLVQSI